MFLVYLKFIQDFMMFTSEMEHAKVWPQPASTGSKCSLRGT